MKQSIHKNKYNFLKKIYENLKNPCAYSGVKKLYNHVKKSGRKNITEDDIRFFLRDQEGWNKHGVIYRNFVRRPIKVCRPGLILGIDLIDLTQKIANHNSRHRYIFLKIDLFSRKICLTPITNKSNKTCAKVLESFFEKAPYKYKFIFSDLGWEFVGVYTQKVYDRFNITRYSSKNQKHKCAIAERAVRSTKEKLYRYFTQKNTWKYLDILKDIEDAHNNTPHKGLAFDTPNAVHALTDLEKIKKQERLQLAQKYLNYGSIKLQEKRKKVSKTQALEKGTHVRLLLAKAEQVFQKGYDVLYTDEIFLVDKVVRKFPYTYYLKDLNGEPIEGLVYRQEMKVVNLPKKHIISKVLKKEVDKKTGKIKYLVSWQGYPESFNSYVDKIETKLK